MPTNPGNISGPIMLGCMALGCWIIYQNWHELPVIGKISGIIVIVGTVLCTIGAVITILRGGEKSTS